MNADLVQLAYLLSAVLFIFGLRGLTHPRTAVRGNLLGALGMLVAVVVTLIQHAEFDFTLIAVSLAIGTALGAAMAVRIQMTAMPQLVALFNGFGGGASVLVAGAFLITALSLERTAQVMVATAASGLIGAVTFSGSLVAFGKLQELGWVKDVRFPWQQLANAGLAAVSVGLAVGVILMPDYASAFYWPMVVVSLALGMLLVISIGGADMPVVIALLNSYSGLAAAATGFVLTNNVLIIAGALVGASGLILTRIMCVAMNRSLPNVLFGGFGMDEAAPAAGGAAAEYGTVRSAGPEEAAMILESAQSVVFVPGYGLAVAQAQHICRELADVLAGRGVEVTYGIHPVAGRMPGHMNVLLAEADVPYEQLLEMDTVNPEFRDTDVVMVIGANDVVNPAAQNTPGSPIAGMPVLKVWEARTTMVIKRSLSPGFAGIKNELFEYPNNVMIYGDA
ncbi:MAG: NAD(P)(+) transhydrogenase (Re/Si-specific) subunit beta, partial [Planctomycetes bacterium]|nr:NAD(P)(+) transhydrogenase (Re/Si-specific) subunit beta [Planctomycetota bacterium]